MITRGEKKKGERNPHAQEHTQTGPFSLTLIYRKKENRKTTTYSIRRLSFQKKNHTPRMIQDTKGKRGKKGEKTTGNKRTLGNRADQKPPEQ